MSCDELEDVGGMVDEGLEKPIVYGIPSDWVARTIRGVLSVRKRVV